MRAIITPLDHEKFATSSVMIELTLGVLFQPVGTAESIHDTVAVVPVCPLMLFKEFRNTPPAL